MLFQEFEISKQVYNYVLNGTSNEYKWLTYIKNILSNTSNGIIWITHNRNQVKNIHTQIRHNLIDQFRQEWSQQLTQSQKARNYSLFKLDLRLELYLSTLSSSLAISLFLFRTANHKLPVEFGRWNGTPYTERKGTKCMSSAICDEMHCLFSCPYFKALWQTFIPENYSNNTFNFNMLLNESDKNKLTNLSKFVSSIMKQFQS